MKKTLLLTLALSCTIAAASNFPKPGDVEYKTFSSASEDGSVPACTEAKTKTQLYLKSMSTSFIVDGSIKEVYAEPTISDCSCQSMRYPGGQGNIPPEQIVYTCSVDLTLRWKLR